MIDPSFLRLTKPLSKGQLMDKLVQAAEAMGAQAAEIERLQRIIDSRPAINAGLPQTYIEWSQSIYVMQAAQARETKQ